MRTYTLAFSILVHLLIVGGFVMTPLVAIDELPEPRRPVEFIEVVPPPAPTVPPPPAAGSTRVEAVNPHAAPIEAPDRMTPETPFEPFEGAGSQDFVVGGVDVGVLGSVLTNLPPPPPPVQPAAPIRVGGSIRPPRKIHDVAPVYPALALSARKEGIVILEAEIGEDGRVRNTRLLRSIPLLDEAAMAAVRQWRFTPTLLNGEPVPVVMTVTVAFTLQRSGRSSSDDPIGMRRKTAFQMRRRAGANRASDRVRRKPAGILRRYFDGGSMRALLTLGLVTALTVGTMAQTTELKVGDPAPDFTLQASDGKTYSLSDFKGTKAVVVAWFPKAFTSGCTIECKSLAEKGHLIRKYDVSYFMASVDPLTDNKGFAEKEKADFPILSDPTKETAKAYGVLSERGFASRWTFYVDRDGRIAHIDKSVKPATSAEDMAAKLGELNTAAAR